ncbi:hypothetical protein MMC28_009224 [Mycoblastus sanguinarius]|nr:hypothetical protein [Mycoblastus sanguinarius]
MSTDLKSRLSVLTRDQLYEEITKLDAARTDLEARLEVAEEENKHLSNHNKQLRVDKLKTSRAQKAVKETTADLTFADIRRREDVPSTVSSRDLAARSEQAKPHSHHQTSDDSLSTPNQTKQLESHPKDSGSTVYHSTNASSWKPSKCPKSPTQLGKTVDLMKAIQVDSDSDPDGNPSGGHAMRTAKGPMSQKGKAGVQAAIKRKSRYSLVEDASDEEDVKRVRAE